MTVKKLCKSCCKFMLADGGIMRIDAKGRYQFRCRNCVEKVKSVNSERKLF